MSHRDLFTLPEYYVFHLPIQLYKDKDLNSSSCYATSHSNLLCLQFNLYFHPDSSHTPTSPTLSTWSKDIENILG